MTSQQHFSFSFPKEMDGLIDFLFVSSLFLGIRPSKNIKKKINLLNTINAMLRLFNEKCICGILSDDTNLVNNVLL